MVFTVRAIIEVIGHPEDHINNVASKILENLKKESGFTVLKENISKAESIKESIFASHIDVDVKFIDLKRLLDFCYDYLPSDIQVIDTDKIIMPVREVNDGLAEMIRKLHSLNLMLHNLNETNKELKEKFEKK